MRHVWLSRPCAWRRTLPVLPVLVVAVNHRFGEHECAFLKGIRGPCFPSKGLGFRKLWWLFTKGTFLSMNPCTIRTVRTKTCSCRTYIGLTQHKGVLSFSPQLPRFRYSRAVSSHAPTSCVFGWCFDRSVGYRARTFHRYIAPICLPRWQLLQGVSARVR